MTEPDTVSGRRKGSSGCLTVFAAGVAIVLLVVIAAEVTGGSVNSNAAKGTASPRDYLTYCAAGLEKAKSASWRMEDYELVFTDPTVLSSSKPGRAQCALSGPRGRAGAVTVEVVCGAGPIDCTHLVSAVANGKVVVAPPRK